MGGIILWVTQGSDWSRNPFGIGYKTRLVAPKPGGGGCQRGHLENLRRHKGQIYDRKKVRNSYDTK